jgi:lipopolysaccharide export system permease protein
MSFVLPMTLFSYLSRRYLQIVLIATLGLVTFISFIEIIEILRRAGNKAPDLSALYVILVSLLNIPSIFDQALPFGVLFGSITCFHLWSRSHEFLVARVMGQNIWQALMPVMITVFLLGCVHVAIINPVASASAKQYNFVMKSIFGQADASELSVLTNGVWVRDSDASYNVIINGGSLEVKNSLIIDPIIYHLNQEGQLLWRTQAASMKLTKNGWIIVDAVKISNAGESSILGDVIMPTVLRPSDLSESTLPPKTVSIYRLPNFIEVQQRAGLPVNPHLVFFHQLLSTPLKLLGLALLAASFTLTSFSRQTKVRLILVGVASGFGIYFLSNFVYLLGSSAKLPHLLAGWGPAVMVCLLSGFLLARADE